MVTLKTELEGLSACEKGVLWASQFRGARQECWAACERPDWMLWYLGTMVALRRFHRKNLVIIACQCARTALQYASDGEKIALAAIETVEAWAGGTRGVSLRDVHIVAKAAYAAADAVAKFDHSAFSSSYAAFCAANTAYCAANTAAWTASSAAFSAAHAAVSAAHGCSADVRQAAYRAMVRIIRRSVPKISVVKPATNIVAGRLP